MEQATEAPQQRQQKQLSSATVCSPEHDAVQVFSNELLNKVIDVPGDAGTGAQQRSVAHVVEVADGTTVVNLLDQEPLDETQRVERPVRTKAAPVQEGSLARAARLELERVRFEEEARRCYKRVEARSPNAKRRTH